MLSFDSDELLLQNLAGFIIKNINKKCELTTDEYEKYVECLKTHFFAESEIFKARFVQGYRLLAVD